MPSDEEERETTEIVEPDPETEEGTDETEAPEGDDLKAELERARAALKKANREAASRRKQLETYEAAEAARKEAEMSEQEKLQATLTEMEQRAKDAETRLDLLVKQQAFAAAAAKLNLTWANEQARQDAALLVDLSEVDDDEMEEAVKELKKNRPYLFVQPPARDIDGSKRGKTTASDEEAAILDASRRYGVQIYD